MTNTNQWDPVRTLGPGIADHLVIEFGDRGQRAIDFLETAWTLLQHSDSSVPRLGETIAYTLREALIGILQSQDQGEDESWSAISRDVVNAKQRYDQVKGLPGGGEDHVLRDLVACIDELEAFHNGHESVHHRKLIAILLDRTGISPVTSQRDLVGDYQGLLNRSNAALHNDTSLSEAHALWTDCVGLLRTMFLAPDVRNSEMTALAQEEYPTAKSMETLSAIVATPVHLNQFLAQVVTPKWLELATRAFYDSSQIDSRWLQPILNAAVRLAESHPDEIECFLRSLYDDSSKDPNHWRLICLSAGKVGRGALGLVLQVLKDHQTDPTIVHFAIGAAMETDPSDEVFQGFADHLLNRSCWQRLRPHSRDFIDRLVAGVDSAESAERHIKLLCYKIKTGSDDQTVLRDFERYRPQSIAELGEYEAESLLYVLINSLARVLSHAKNWMETTSLLTSIGDIDLPIRHRMRAWLLSLADDVNLTTAVDELAWAIGHQNPNADTLKLLDRIVGQCEPSQYFKLFQDALGESPTIPEVSAILTAGSWPVEWWRTRNWSVLLPSGITMHWTDTLAILEAARGAPPSRAYFETPSTGGALEFRSPIASEDLMGRSALEAAAAVGAWRPDPAEWPHADPRLLGMELEEVVKQNPAEWVAFPLKIATTLRHPIYIRFYLRGLSQCSMGNDTPLDELLDLIGLLRGRPWHFAIPGSHDADSDDAWREVDREGVDLMKSLAATDLGFGTRSEEVWQILVAEVRDRSEPSGLSGSSEDPLDAAINRPFTRALEAIFSVMGYEFRQHQNTRADALEILKETLNVDGVDGLHARSIIGPRINFLLHIAPDWVYDNRNLIFGDDAPDDLGQGTVEITLRRGQPCQWLFENFRDEIKAAVTKGDERLLQKLMLAMLWEWSGYTPVAVVGYFRGMPELLSASGNALGVVMRGVNDEPLIARTAEYWQTAIDTRVPDGLLGFGRLALVEGLEASLWAEKTLATLELTGGRIELASTVAERCTYLAPSPTTLAIVNRLVRGSTGPGDVYLVARSANQLLDGATELNETDDYERLETALTERGSRSPRSD